MIVRTLALAAASLFALPAQAAINVTLERDASGLFDSFEYVQNFDSLASANGSTDVAWANDSTIAGWSLFDSKLNARTFYRASSGADSGGYFYSYGLNGDGERALGALGSGGAYWGSPASSALSGYMAVAFRNDSGSSIENVGVYFDAEQWRVGQANVGTDTLDFRYGFGDSFASVQTWINPGVSFKYNSSVVNTASAAGFATDGNANAVTLGGDIATDWQAGQTLWITWIDYNSSGFDHGLAIDNVSLSVAVTAVPEPASIAMLLAGLGIVGASVRRARRN
jgi:hypothetical protein